MEEIKETEEEKRRKRAERFGIMEKKGSNLIMSSKEDIDKRKERFKDLIEQNEAEQKEKEEKEKEKERSRDKNRRKNNNDGYRYNNYRNNYRRDDRGRGRFNQYRKFRGERRNFRK